MFEKNIIIIVLIYFANVVGLTIFLLTQRQTFKLFPCFCRKIHMHIHCALHPTLVIPFFFLEM
jgi:hypothetical protein